MQNKIQVWSLNYILLIQKHPHGLRPHSLIYKKKNWVFCPEKRTILFYFASIFNYRPLSLCCNRVELVPLLYFILSLVHDQFCQVLFQCNPFRWRFILRNMWRFGASVANVLSNQMIAGSNRTCAKIYKPHLLVLCSRFPSVSPVKSCLTVIYIKSYVALWRISISDDAQQSYNCGFKSYVRCSLHGELL